jgi:hypothetical protein
MTSENREKPSVGARARRVQLREVARKRRQEERLRRRMASLGGIKKRLERRLNDPAWADRSVKYRERLVEVEAELAGLNGILKSGFKK